MKNRIIFILGFAFMLSSCTTKTDSLMGHWTVDKVNVQFDETHSTPELVKQIGEMEKQNTLHITADSVLVFKSLDNEIQGRIKADANGNLFLDGTLFGRWKSGQIITTTTSPLGEVVVTYRKE